MAVATKRFFVCLSVHFHVMYNKLMDQHIMINLQGNFGIQKI